MPTPFSYLDGVALKYSHDEFQVQTRQQPYLDALTPSDLEALATAYLEVERRGDTTALARYAQQSSDGHSRRLLLLLLLFEALAKRGIAPFLSGVLSDSGEKADFDWSKLPRSLAFLAGPAERYGKYQFDDEIEGFLSAISPAQLEELTALNRRLTPDWDRAEKFIRDHPMTEHIESRYVYFLFHIIARLNDANMLD